MALENKKVDEKNDKNASKVQKKKIKDKKEVEEVNIIKKICMHPECYHVLAVQDESDNSNIKK